MDSSDSVSGRSSNSENAQSDTALRGSDNPDGAAFKKNFDGSAAPGPAASSRVDIDSAWDRFIRPAQSAEFLAGWLEIAVGRIEGAQTGVLFLRGDGNQFGIAAAVSFDPSLQEQVQTFVQKLSQRPQARIEMLSGAGRAIAGYPLESDGELQAMFVAVLGGYEVTRMRQVMRDMHWAVGWIDAQLWHGKSSLRNRQAATARLALDLIAAADEHERFDGAALSVVNVLPEMTGFDRAAIGMIRRGRVRLEALSRTASFKKKADMVADLEAAMDEAIAQDDLIVHPQPHGERRKIDVAHRRLAARAGSGAILTAPLIVRGRPVGALLLERARENDEIVVVDPQAIEELRLATAAVAPVLRLKHDERRWVSGRGRNLAGRGMTAVFGRRPAIALGTIAAAVAITLPFVIHAPMRISGNATLEGKEQRAAVSLVDGFIRESAGRAGDRVSEGDLLARLDDRDLRLELNRNEAAVAEAQQAVRTALSSGDRTAGAEASAKLAESRAAFQLNESRLSRLDILSPMNGIIVSGDLTQKLGAPVSRGEVIFEIARLDDFRVMIDVSEYDLAPVEPGQTGTLVLNAVPGKPLAIEVNTISSVSSPENSENSFRVVAQVATVPPQARPGMEGIAKIETGEASLAWIWFRSTVRRLQLFAWRWLP